MKFNVLAPLFGLAATALAAVNCNSPAPETHYSAVNGDTKESIAAKFQVPVCELVLENPSLNLDALQQNDYLYIPAQSCNKQPCETGQCTYYKYTIVQGDYLYAISTRLNILGGLDALEAANTWIDDYNVIYPGQVLNIPVCSSWP